MSVDEVAVRVDHLSKIYHLWNSPRDRLIHPLKRVVNSILPAGLRTIDADHRGYREFHALEDVSFEIKRGESWGFIGVNGSGKSTLLKIISGNLRPSAGRVEVEGKVAILDYGSGFNGEFTGRENIFHKGALLGLSRKQIEERLEAIVEFADIGEFIDQPVKAYSSGMGARLGFSIMAHVDAEIMITDEALAVGDAFFVQKCMRHIRGFLKRGTFLFVSHSVNDVMSLCDHAVWLDRGRVVRIGTANEVCRAYLSSIELKNSRGFVAAKGDDVAPNPSVGAVNGASIPVVERAPPRPIAEIHLSSDQLAALKRHYAPVTAPGDQPAFRTACLEVDDNLDFAADSLEEDGAVGGGRIFSVTITNDAGQTLTSVIGGEVASLTVRAIAEKPIEKPILGFQLKNRLGLTLVAENTFLVSRDQDMALQPGEVITARFRFAMPLVPIGEYVIRAGLASGIEESNALLDVRHEALLLRCIASSARHGLVGIPMLGIDISRASASDAAFAN